MVLGLTVDGADLLAQGQPSLASETVTSVGESTPTYLVLGVPLRTGSLYPGNRERCSSLPGGQPDRTPQRCWLQSDGWGRRRDPELSPTSLGSSNQKLARSQNRLGYCQRKGLGDATAARADPSPDWM